MHVVAIGLTNPIQWRIAPSDPTTVSLPNLDGWSLINPLVPVAPRFGEDHVLHISSDDTCLFTTRNVHLVSPGGRTAVDDALKLSTALLQRLRIATKQPGLSSDVAVAGPFEIEALPDLEFPNIQVRTGIKYMRGVDTTAVTLERVLQVVSDGLESRIPVHGELILDAIQAHHGGDYPKAVLYTAFSLEVLAASSIETECNTLLASRPSHMRFVELTVVDGETVIKDPVATALKERARRSFRTLLHELPLYVLGRSLMVDSHSVYTDAVELHDLRNRVAHLGQLPVDGLTTSRRGLRTAEKVFEWFGEDNYFLALPETN